MSDTCPKRDGGIGFWLADIPWCGSCNAPPRQTTLEARIKEAYLEGWDDGSYSAEEMLSGNPASRTREQGWDASEAKSPQNVLDSPPDDPHTTSEGAK